MDGLPPVDQRRDQANIHRTADKSAFENGTVEFRCTPRPRRTPTEAFDFLFSRAVKYQHRMCHVRT